MLTFICVLPVVLSALLLSAHFVRTASYALVALAVAMPLLLLVRRWWAARAVQVFLLLGAAEWLRTMLAIAEVREEVGLPYARMLVILGAVMLVTAFSSWLFMLPRMRRRYWAA